MFGKAASSFYFSIFQILIILLKDPAAKVIPSGLNEIELISAYPLNVTISFCVSTFHNFIVLSPDPLANIFPL